MKNLLKIEEQMELNELLDSKEFSTLINNLKHEPQMQKQNYYNSLSDTGRQPEHMYNNR